MFCEGRVPRTRGPAVMRALGTLPSLRISRNPLVAFGTFAVVIFAAYKDFLLNCYLWLQPGILDRLQTFVKEVQIPQPQAVSGQR
jgi:hypothetical protein